MLARACEAYAFIIGVLKADDLLYILLYKTLR